MMEPLRPIDAPGDALVSPPVGAQIELQQLDSLLNELKRESSSPSLRALQLSDMLDNQLAVVRLGVASSLFTALRCKHSATAKHALRVALTCSAWSYHMGLLDRQRDVIEVASLLHDIGMIGLPDRVILKPGGLTQAEAVDVIRARHMSLEILQCACNDHAILSIVESVGAWYDGSRPGFPWAGEVIPLGARMIGIVEAFDAMTASSIYRSAMTHERALAELQTMARRQFDPELVRRFQEFFGANPYPTHAEAAKQWLRRLDPEASNAHWELRSDSVPRCSSHYDLAFQEKMLDDMRDAVIFLDMDQRVIRWNRGAERLTGMPASIMLQQPHLCEMVEMYDDKGVRLDPGRCDECPIGCALREGVGSSRRITVRGRKDVAVAVDCQAIPVSDERGARLGAIIVWHDASTQITWEERCQSLMEKARLDPLTRLSNRAEFDRVHEVFLTTHQRQDAPCSLIMCDIDHFKHVNDTFGHQAGDAVIRALADVLKGACRAGDVVGRYGGEEFVMLCAETDAAAATVRAEQIRLAFGRVTHPALGGQAVTASFGVTEDQPGDTAETMLRRADRGLLMAKSRGRNRVVQLGSGHDADLELPVPVCPEGETQGRADTALMQELLIAAPIGPTLQKLRAFVADHRARIVQTDRETNCVWMSISHRRAPARRAGDRPMDFQLQLELFEVARDPAVSGQGDDSSLSDGSPLAHGDGADADPTLPTGETRIRVTIARTPSRNRRSSDHTQRGGELLASLRSYLMASAAGPVQFTNVPAFPQERGLTAWLRRAGALGGRRN